MIFKILNTFAQIVGYSVLSIVLLIVLLGAYMKRQSNDVSDEARELAKAVDPNNGVTEDATAVLMDDFLDGIRELQPDETIRADPGPITYFDWSERNATQEDIEHIIYTLSEAGYYTHPLPKIETHRDVAKWDSERAGVWNSKPDWHIVEFQESGTEVKEEVDVPVPDEWCPST